MTDLEDRLRAAKQHFSHPYAVLGQWQPLGPQCPLLNQFIASTLVTWVFGIVMFVVISCSMYLVQYIWFKGTFTPKREQYRYERETYAFDIKWSLINLTGEAPLVTLIKMGYPYFSKIQYEWTFTPMTIFYILFHFCYDEFFTYWGHRILHHPWMYRNLHRIHHKTKAVTPFSGIAFHPLDAFIQAVPVLTSCYFVPININFVLIHGVITSIWAFSIHDNVNLIPFKGILFAGSHSIHHFPWGEEYNYGKFTSVCDRLYGTYCDPQGITGFGYKPPQAMQPIINKLNKWYTTLVPDNGIKTVSKIREIYGKKIK